ncbi:MAG: hypothetical protein PHG66_00010 [Candidatus Colwellbacteria bacterium]|nr:hypothetical protein [Candidatus Colwellbacteria bacterium]
MMKKVLEVFESAVISGESLVFNTGKITFSGDWTSNIEGLVAFCIILVD